MTRLEQTFLAVECDVSRRWKLLLPLVQCVEQTHIDHTLEGSYL